MEKSTCSSACCFTCDWTNMVHCFRIESGTQPIEKTSKCVGGQARCVFVVCGECVPVRNKEKTFVRILQLYPVLQRANIVPQVELSSRTHAAQDAGA